MANSNGGHFEQTEPGKNAHPDAAKFSDQGVSFRKAVEDREEATKMRDLLKRSIAALSTLARQENSAVNERLADFKNTVLQETAIEQMETSLAALRHAMFNGEQLAEGDGQKVRGPLLKPAQTAPVIDANDLRKNFQSIFLGLISEFDHDYGEDYAGSLLTLRKKIEKSAQIDDIVELKDDIIGLAQNYMQMINAERTLITDFISEIGAGLLEVERQYLDSINQTGQSHKENKKFNSLLENQVEDMKKSAQLSTTLAEFRGIVMSRLASIRTALEEKRRAEALVQEKLTEEMESLNENLDRMKKEVDQVHAKRRALEKEVLIDPLSGVANRRALKDRLKNELYRFQRYGQFFSMLLFDIDQFKVINDRHGHWAGDRCIKEIVKRIRPILRETDLMGRWGGDEFLVIFAGTDVESTAAVAERLRKLIENTRFVYHKQEISLTVSIGVTETKASDTTVELAFNRVDKAMYQAKKKGRNMIAVV
ncbi:MAG: diguanylate cyclase [Syntrophobacteraceae bacterium]